MSFSKDFIVASFDIGVKNLAFCVLNFDNTAKDGFQYPIHCWKDVNLMDDNEIDYQKCSSQLKKKGGGVCGKSAKIKTDDGMFTCMMHNPDKEKYKPRKKRNVNTISRKEMCVALIETLDRYPLLLDGVDRIVIEQQFKMNPKMITLSNMLYSYFIMKGVMDKNKRLSDVAFISSRNKYKIYNGPFLTSDLKNAKAKRKALAIEYCKYMIREDKENLKFLNEFAKKKDDISDCFLQGAYYLNNLYQKELKKKSKRKRKKKPKIINGVMSIAEAFKVV